MISPLRMRSFNGERRLISCGVIDAPRSGLRLCVCLLECKAIARLTGMRPKIWFNNGHLRYSLMTPNVVRRRRL